MSERFILDDRFVEAFANRKHVVYGRVLAPYSLWHHFNLEIAQSPVLLGEPLNPLTLLYAVRICTTPWTPVHYLPDLTEPGLLRFMWEAGRFNFQAEARKFLAYFSDFNSAPKLWTNDHKNHEQNFVADRDFDANLELALYVLKNTAMSRQDVWTMPIGMLHWTSVGLQKLEGAKIDIWTPEHDEMFAEHKRKREAKIDERGKVIAAETGLPFAEARKQAHDEHWAAVNETYGHAAQPKPHA